MLVQVQLRSEIPEGLEPWMLADEAGQEAHDGVPEHRSRSAGEVRGFEGLLRGLLGDEADLVEEVARERMRGRRRGRFQPVRATSVPPLSGRA